MYQILTRQRTQKAQTSWLRWCCCKRAARQQRIAQFRGLKLEHGFCLPKHLPATTAPPPAPLLLISITLPLIENG